MKPLDEAMRRAETALFYADSEDASAMVKAVLDSLAADGWLLAPRVATDDMLATGKIAAVATHRVDQVYESMVAAAPKLGETT